MSGLTWRWVCAFVCCVVFVLASLSAPTTRAGDKPAEKPALSGPLDATGKPLPRMYFGLIACATAGCHEKGQVANPPLLCRCDEMDRWKADDKHADAYQVLLGQRGQQMLKILGYPNAESAKACLGCHAVVLQSDKEKGTGFNLADGVSCVVCHGPYNGWIGEHSLAITRPAFRILDRKTKEQKYGMTDLWDPQKRAKLCASCHIGNVDEGKVVTHDMYAAGHPPLPGFEIASFSNQMPRHWQYLAEKTDPGVRKILGYDGKEDEQAKLVLVGAAVSLAESMRLYAKEADKALNATKEDDKVLDLAHFDCWACHHDLTSPSWRQARGYEGKPGRIPMKAWPTELIILGLQHLGNNPTQIQAFKDQLAKVQKAFTERQYGNPAVIKTEATNLANWADKLAAALNASTVGKPEAQKLLAAIPTLYKDKLLDFDSARQVGWAYDAILDSLSGYADKKEDPLLVKLRDDFGLKLPFGRMKPGQDGTIVTNLGPNLKRIYNYKPEPFRDLLRALDVAKKDK